VARWPAGQHEQAQGDLGATGEGVGLAPGQLGETVGGDAGVRGPEKATVDQNEPRFTAPKVSGGAGRIPGQIVRVFRPALQKLAQNEPASTAPKVSSGALGLQVDKLST
jgi:hypothetical protein